MTIVDAGTNQGIGAGEQFAQTGETHWSEQFGEQYGKDAAITRYKTFDDFAAGHKELESKLGSAISPLPENPTDEQKKTYRAKVGCPEKVEGYEVVKPTLPEGMAFDEELIKSASQFAYDNHIPKGVFEGLVKLVFERQMTTSKALIETNAKAQAEAQAEKDKAITTAENELKGKWGANYDGNLEMANRFYDLPGDDKVNKTFTDLMAEKGLNSHPTVVEFMCEAYKLVKEDTIPEGGSGAAGTVQSGQLAYPKSPDMQKET